MIAVDPTTDLWTKPFIPARLTPLPHVPSWSGLTPTEQLRYNQLQGLYFHEQIIYFEQRMIVPLMSAARRATKDTYFQSALESFVAEENAHSAHFHALLRTFRPDWYSRSWQHFVRVDPLTSSLLTFVANHPRQFPFLIWLVQLLEERTMYASRQYLAEAPLFPELIVAAQKQHLVDEADHVQWDIQLLNEFWSSTPPWLRRVNAAMLDWMVGEFIAVPRRAALRVIDALAADLPHLSVPAARLKAELRALADDPDFARRVFGRDAVPRTWRQAALAPDLDRFAKRWFVHEHTR